MAHLDHIIDQLGAGELAVHEAAGVRSEVSLQKVNELPVWIVRFYRPDLPPHDALAFESAADLLTYFEAADMLEGWTHQPASSVSEP